MANEEPSFKILKTDKENDKKNDKENEESEESEDEKKEEFRPYDLAFLLKSNNIDNIIRYLKNIKISNINQLLILGVILREGYNLSLNNLILILELLKTNGIDINATNSIGNNMLKCAIINNNFKIVKAIVAVGANLNLCFPLQVTIAQNYYEVFEFLLEAGSDPNLPDEDGNTPLLLAAYYRNHKFFEKIISIESVNLLHTNRNKYNALMLACDSCKYTNISNSHIVNVLLEKGLPVNGLNIYNRSALSICCSCVDEYTNLIIITLLDAGADPNVIDTSGNTPLLLLSKNIYADFTYNIVSSMITLINHGANKNHKNHKAETIYNLMIDEVKQWFDVCSTYAKSNINQKIFINKNCLICMEEKNKMVYLEACQHIVMCFECFQKLGEHNIENGTFIKKCPLCSTQIADHRIVEYIN
jgi:ankyrin repeat protein